MTNAIVIGIVLVIVGAAVVYIIKAKKSGVKCIGCPAGGSCSQANDGHSECCCGCQSDTEEKK